MTPRNADDLAVEHGTLARDGDGWTTGAHAACAIRKNEGSGARSDLGANRAKVDEAPLEPDTQVSVRRYSEKSGLPRDTVDRILQAWDGSTLVPKSDTLTPADFPRVVAALPNEAEHPWKDAYKGLGRNGPDAARERLLRDPESLVAKMQPKQRLAVVTAITKRQPDAIVQAVKADPEVADELQRGAGPELFDAGNRVRAEKVFNHEAQAIANGGRIPSLDEINGPAPGEGGYNQFIPVINRLHDAERLVDKAYTLIVEARQIMPLTESMEKQVQAMALHILESLDKEQAE